MLFTVSMEKEKQSSGKKTCLYHIIIKLWKYTATANWFQLRLIWVQFISNEVCCVETDPHAWK